MSLPSKVGFGHKDFMGDLDDEEFLWDARGELGIEREVRK